MESGVRQLTEQDLNNLSTTKQVQYGAQGSTPDGRKYRYVSFGGTSVIKPGVLMVAPAYTAGYDGLVITATSVANSNTTASLSAGSTKLYLTNGSTAVTQDLFAEGYLEVLQTNGTNQGPIFYKVKGNDAAAGSGSPTFAVYLVAEEPLRNTVALLPGTDTANVQVSPYNGVAASATAATSIGATISLVPNSATVTNYGWVQTGGLVPLINDAGGTVTVGEGIAQSTSVAGAIVAVGATTKEIGQMRLATAASTIGPVWLSLD